MFNSLIVALSAALIPVTGTYAPQLPNARPAIWVVNDHDTVIYLFGTFHALDGRSEWFNDEVVTAFYASEELVLETVVPMPVAAAAPAPPAQGPSMGMSVPAFGRVAGSASYLSTGKMVMSAGRSRGMSTDKGADAVLRRAADEIGKPVSGLESFDYQMSLFSRLPGAKQPTSAAQAADVSTALTELLGRLQEAWNRGDIESFGPMLEQMRAQSPDTYRLLFVDRNERWAGWIANRLQQPGVVFVAVGAGHLAGNDSVQHKLASVGIRSARIN